MRKAKKRWFPALTAVLMTISLTAVGAKAAVESPKMLVPVGHTAGIKLFSEGVMVVDLADKIGDEASPAKNCGLKKGDMIEKVNGVSISSTEHLQEYLQQEKGENVELTVSRGGKTLSLNAAPAQNDDGVYCLGAWIRDSVAGIGTITFYDPETKRFGALGHGISDVDTALLMPLSDGSIMDSQVKTVRRGAEGSPGELKGEFDLKNDAGTLYANTDAGVFGTLSGENDDFTRRAALPTAAAGEVHIGEAVILANVQGDEVKEYTAEISRVYAGVPGNRNFLVTVTDDSLLEITGGIVQGMSGSPVIQNGKLVGAVTHVLVDDPTRGYAIFAENMLETAQGVADEKALKDAS